MKKMMFNDRYGLTQAVIHGRKTVTRRVVKDAWWPISKIEAEGMRGDIIHVIANNGKFVVERKCPYKIGEIVAVAQRYDSFLHPNNGVIEHDYQTTACASKGWDNKMFVRADLMPHQIQITDLRIERLQDISKDDCFKEGIRPSFSEYLGLDKYGYIDDKGTGLWFNSPREAFASLIDNVSGRSTWKQNPFVWRIEFKKVK